MTALILSVLLLLLAPLFARFVKARPHIRAGFDGFVLVTIIGLVTLTLLPEALAHGGFIALLIAFFGLTLPWISEFLFHKAEAMTHRIVLMVASFALVLHAGSDGALIAYANDASGGAYIKFGILLHRAGIAITIWWLFRSMLSSSMGFVLLGALGLTTVIGYFFVTLVTEVYALPVFGYWQAFAAGSLLHIILHPLEHHSIAGSPAIKRSSRIGTTAGIFFIASLIFTHYLEHSPLDTAGPHSAHHAIDLLVDVGILIAPILLMALVTLFGIQKLGEKEWRQAFEKTLQFMPWTLVSWFGLTIILAIVPDLIPLGQGSVLLFSVWLALIIGTLIYQGARAFFNVLVAPLHRHIHVHGES